MTDHPLDKVIIEMEGLIKTLEFIQSEVSKFQWISFKESCPEEHIEKLHEGFFLVTDGEFTRQAKYLGGAMWSYPDYMKAITHWMPLPKPPEIK